MEAFALVSFHAANDLIRFFSAISVNAYQSFSDGDYLSTLEPGLPWLANLTQTCFCTEADPETPQHLR